MQFHVEYHPQEVLYYKFLRIAIGNFKKYGIATDSCEKPSSLPDCRRLPQRGSFRFSRMSAALLFTRLIAAAVIMIAAAENIAVCAAYQHNNDENPNPRIISAVSE